MRIGVALNEIVEMHRLIMTQLFPTISAFPDIGRSNFGRTTLHVGQEDVVLDRMSGYGNPGVEDALVGQAVLATALAIDGLMTVDNRIPAQQQQSAV